eukprot:CAMPEP_0170468684 /NCGR_PEP_ID=MMETSP0123-20130129/11767_1 /TAXON_ID=182087 /ORGANISM="Favella ehrenbergii, Strain Fehren 1" /LENGTH=79 /DNA_ID=CAMNT_0010735305 /DNA_START=293 /DNA_END=532 /DNA_ORIENTATION=-
MLEGVLVSVLEDVDVELAAENHVVVHGPRCDLGNFALGELEEGVAAGPGCLDGARDAQFGHLAKLLEEVLQLRLVEAFG